MSRRDDARGDARLDDPRQTGHRREFDPRHQPRQSFAERKELALTDVAVFRTVFVRDLTAARFGGHPFTTRKAINSMVRAGWMREHTAKGRRAANSKSSPSPQGSPTRQGARRQIRPLPTGHLVRPGQTGRAPPRARRLPRRPGREGQAGGAGLRRRAHPHRRRDEARNRTGDRHPCGSHGAPPRGAEFEAPHAPGTRPGPPMPSSNTETRTDAPGASTSRSSPSTTPARRFPPKPPPDSLSTPPAAAEPPAAARLPPGRESVAARPAAAGPRAPSSYEALAGLRWHHGLRLGRHRHPPRRGAALPSHPPFA